MSGPDIQSDGAGNVLANRLLHVFLLNLLLLTFATVSSRAIGADSGNRIDYADVDESFWAYPQINALENAGFNIRCTQSPRRFCPSDILQSSVMAMWLSKASNGVDYRPPAPTGTRFADMPVSHWASGWAEDLDRKRIYRGCGDQTNFCPTSLLTRAQFAFFLVRAVYGVDFRPEAATGLYVDVPVDYWAAAHIEQLRRDGIDFGCRTNSDEFCPNFAVSRASAAVWLVRYFDIDDGDDDDDDGGNYTETSPPRSNDNVANPHRGFMFWGSSSYQTDPDNPDTFTYVSDDPFSTGASVYHVYVSWRDVEPSDQNFDWSKLERQRLLPIIRNDPDATFVLRMLADYPGGASQGSSALYTGGNRDRDFPEFISSLGIRTVGYGPAFNQPVCAQTSGSGVTPDWNDSRMISQMEQLVDAFGARFDGDPRITAIQTGTLGLWGEGHQWQCPHNIDVGDAAKEAIRRAYDRAFTQTPVQTRYPGIPEATGVEFGFYEDYFPSFTVQCSSYPEFDSGLCSDGGDWNLYYGYTNLTPASIDNWKSSPISGESPLGDQQSYWINKTSAIRRALDEYHFSFLGPAGAHNGYYNSDGSISGINSQVIENMPASERGNPVPYMSRKLAEMQSALGYRLHLESAKWPSSISVGDVFDLSLNLANSGVAPLYYSHFSIEVTLVNGQGQDAWRALWDYSLEQVMPGQRTPTLSRDFVPTGLAVGDYSLRISIAPGRQGRLDQLLGQSRGPSVAFESSPRDNRNRVIVGDVSISN